MLPLVSMAEWSGADYRRSELPRSIPDAILTDPSGKSFSLAQELAAEGPVVLNFFSVHCGEKCAERNRVLGEVQGKALGRAGKLRVISIAAEPRTSSTASRMRVAAKEMQAGPGWMVLAGFRHDVDPLLRAFGMEAEKVDLPILFLHVAPAAPWVRIEGRVSSSELLSELR